jgi:RNA polymerase sigma-70 factor (ECF subfamily)
VESAGNGDREAMGELVKRHQNRLYRFCYFLCHNSEMAQDLCQETLAKGLVKLAALKDPSAFMSWLMRMARNEFLDQIRHQKHVTKHEQDAVRYPEPNILSPATSPEEVSRLRDALQLLEENDRSILLLVDLEQFTHEEVAKMVGLSPDAVRGRAFRARKLVREYLNKG